MGPEQKFKLNNLLAYVAAAVLMMCFFIALAFTVLPNLPFPKNPTDWGWSITSWNLAGPLMFIMVFRIHALRVLSGRIRKEKHLLGITLWVKFWLTAAIFFGLVTLPFLFNTYLIGGAVMPWYMIIGTIGVTSAWFVLIFSTAFLLRIKCSKAMLPAVEKSREIHRYVLAPSSIVFFIFTGLSSITILFT